MRLQICPSCGSEDITPIVYGFPSNLSEFDFETMSPKYILGGCCISEDSPTKHCNSCGQDSGTLRFEWLL
jgi:hypothetical protein